MLLAFIIATAAAAAPAPLVITPENLESLIFKGNSDVAREMNNLLRARNNVDVAFGNVIPSLNFNLGVVATNPPMFLLSSVSCLVPFLFPSSWHGLHAAKEEARAESYGLAITKLNAYAVAYSLLKRFSYDERVLTVLREQYQSLGEYVLTLQQKASSPAGPGQGRLAELEALRGELELRKFDLDVSKVSETIGVERAALRKMLGLDIEQEFEVNFPMLPPTGLEQARTNDALISDLYGRSPEHAQLDYLLESAKDRTKASGWAFLTGCSGSQGSWGPSSNNSFTFSSTFSLSIGYGNFPQISLSKRTIDDLKIRQGELRLELARVFESTQRSLMELKQRLDDTAHAIELGERILIEQKALAEEGKASRKDILDSANGIARAKVELLSGWAALEGHRITLQRLGIEGKFADLLAQARTEATQKSAPKRRGD